MYGFVGRVFFPNPLPPQPPIEILPPLQELLDRAHVSLG